MIYGESRRFSFNTYIYIYWRVCVGIFSILLPRLCLFSLSLSLMAL